MPPQADAASRVAEHLPNTFAPLMIGVVALIAYISLRGVHLSKLTREVLGKVDDYDPGDTGIYAFQIERLTRRHAINSCALISAIFAVMCFGTQLALVPVFDLFGSATNPQGLQESCIGAGGLLAAIASLFSVWETIIAPPSLRTAVAAQTLKLDPRTEADRRYAISLAQRILGFDETRFLGKTMRMLRGEVLPGNLRGELERQLERWQHPEFQLSAGDERAPEAIVTAPEMPSRPR